MATHNNAVTVVAGLSCSVLAAPSIGSSAVASQLAFTDGDTASDGYISVQTSATALNTALTIGANEYGFLHIANPGPLDVTLLVDGSPDVSLGIIPPGTTGAPFAVVIPIGNGVVINATVASGTQNVGVTVLKTDTNV